MSLWNGFLANDDLSMRIFAAEPLPMTLPETTWFFLPALSPEPSAFVVGTRTERRDAWGGEEVYLPRLFSSMIHPFITHDTLLHSGEEFAHAIDVASSAVVVTRPYDWSLYKTVLDDAITLFYSTFPTLMKYVRSDAMYFRPERVREA